MTANAADSPVAATVATDSREVIRLDVSRVHAQAQERVDLEPRQLLPEPVTPATSWAIPLDAKLS